MTRTNLFLRQLVCLALSCVLLVLPVSSALAVDITVTAGSVVAGADASFGTGTAGATITAGQPLYIDTANSNVLKTADANASLLTSTVAGIALHAASTGQPIKYQTSGLITIGATVAVGTIYVVSDTAGGIMPAADLSTGEYVAIIGVATTTGIIKMGLNNSGVAWP